jgi:F-type H+-transporting ATPase subunit delta
MMQLATNYAKALFELNVSETAVKNARDILQNKELMDALSNPVVLKSEKHIIIDSVFEKDIKNFLKVICDNDNIGLIGQIFDIYEDMVLESMGIIRATLTYVTKPDVDQIEKVKEYVCSKYDKKGVVLEFKEDTSLLGGFVLTVGDVEYDKSIKGTLSDMHKALLRR